MSNRLIAGVQRISEGELISILQILHYFTLMQGRRSPAARLTRRHGIIQGIRASIVITTEPLIIYKHKTGTVILPTYKSRTHDHGTHAHVGVLTWNNSCLSPPTAGGSRQPGRAGAAKLIRGMSTVRCNGVPHRTAPHRTAPHRSLPIA